MSAGQVVPFRVGANPAELADQVSFYLARLRQRIAGERFRSGLLSRSDFSQDLAFHAGLDGKRFGTTSPALADAWRRGAALRARLQAQPILTVSPRGRR
jgi:hypothetical protein